MGAGCLCRDCGNRYRVDLNVPDVVWSAIGMPTPAGLLCGACIMVRIERAAAEHDGYGYVIVNEAAIGPVLSGLIPSRR